MEFLASHAVAERGAKKREGQFSVKTKSCKSYKKFKIKLQCKYILVVCMIYSHNTILEH
jgi:hypothetical protein